MAKKYIQNCTGNNCDVESKSKSTKLVSKGVRRSIFYILLVGFVFVLAYIIFFSPYLQISSTAITGLRELNSAELQQRLENSLQGRILGVIPRNNYLFFSQGRVERLLMSDFKKIRSLKVVKKFPDTVSVEIDERKALLVWCSGDKCFLIDEDGHAYTEADFNSPELQQNHLLQINENGGQAMLIGEKVIEPVYEQYVLSIKDSLNKMGYDVVEQYWTPSRMAEEINIKTNQGVDFYFSTQFPLESALRALNTIFKKEIPENKRSDLAYIDLRNETKIFYKFKSVESENVPAENPDEKKEEK